MIKKCLLGLGLTMAALTGTVQANESNGIIAVPYTQENLMVIVDTNSKKMLLYHVSSSKGMTLKEVRSFEDVLEAPNFFTSKGLSGRTEKKELAGLKK
jgi:hypothetical protein